MAKDDLAPGGLCAFELARAQSAIQVVLQADDELIRGLPPAERLVAHYIRKAAKSDAR
jgi:hypothetical protein